MRNNDICRKIIFKTLPNIVVLFLIIALVLLGNWQVRRLEEKRNFIQNIENNIKNPAKLLKNLNTPPPLYSKIKISGKFLSNKNIFLYGRRSASLEKDGYYFFSAFAAEDGNTYMVSRGWMPQTIKNNFNSVKSTSEGTELIEAITLPSEKRAAFVPKNDLKNNIWFTMDLNMATDITESNVTDFYLMQINSTNLPQEIKPLQTTYLNKVRNDHLEYAITWYSLAICLLFMWCYRIWMIRK